MSKIPNSEKKPQQRQKSFKMTENQKCFRGSVWAEISNGEIASLERLNVWLSANFIKLLVHWQERDSFMKLQKWQIFLIEFDFFEIKEDNF